MAIPRMFFLFLVIRNGIQQENAEQSIIGALSKACESGTDEQYIDGSLSAEETEDCRVDYQADLAEDQQVLRGDLRIQTAYEEGVDHSDQRRHRHDHGNRCCGYS